MGVTDAVWLTEVIGEITAPDGTKVPVLTVCVLTGEMLAVEILLEKPPVGACVRVPELKVFTWEKLALELKVPKSAALTGKLLMRHIKLVRRTEHWAAFWFWLLFNISLPLVGPYLGLYREVVYMLFTAERRPAAEQSWSVNLEL
jgi:hypothetical protein